MSVLRQDGGQWLRSDRPAPSGASQHQSEGERHIFCAHCRQPVTHSRYGLEVDGAQVHTFFNPVGIVYEIGCFSRADGCMATGPSSTEFSWFQGTSWRFSLCSSCFSHLGWVFNSDSSSFYGLILKKLIDV